LILQILRHGKAETRVSASSDDERHLTKFGADQVRRSLVIARQIGTKVDSILSSPIVRARETAEIAREEFELADFTVEDVLEPSRSPLEVFQRLSEFEMSSGILLVTHQPLISGLVSSLLNSDEKYFSLRAGTMARIDVEDLSHHRGTLMFLLPPPELEERVGLSGETKMRRNSN